MRRAKIVTLLTVLALLIALGTASYVAGAFIGKLNACLLLTLAPPRWFSNQTGMTYCGPIASCTFFACVILSVWTGDPAAALTALVMPAAAVGWWLNRYDEPPTPSA